MHKEDIKSAIRKRWGTLTAFEAAKSLPRGCVKDVLRGRASVRTEQAISTAVEVPVQELFPRRYGVDSSTKGDNTPTKRDTHRLTDRAA